MVLGVGIDVIDIDRMRGLLSRRPQVAERLFSELEQEYSYQHKDPSQRFAVRFAAKEAVMKALQAGFGSIDWRDVEVTRDESSAPQVRLSGRAAERAAGKGITSWHISLSHSEASAVAVVIAQ